MVQQKFVVKFFKVIIILLYGFALVKLFFRVYDVEEDISNVKRAIIKQYVDGKVGKSREG